jgi:hypothetical protein
VTLAAFGAPGSWFIRVAAETTVCHHFDAGQQGSQRAGSRRFGGSAFTADKNAPDAGIDRIEHQRAAHTVLTNNCSEWIDSWHRSKSSLIGRIQAFVSVPQRFFKEKFLPLLFVWPRQVAVL